MNEEQIACLNKADIVWIREQVSRGALACRAATEAISEVAKAGAHMLVEIFESHKGAINTNHHNGIAKLVINKLLVAPRLD